MKIFISGSRMLDGDITETVLNKIDEHINRNDEFIIGDCRGVDEHVQTYLNRVKYHNVTVYVSGNKRPARYNIGQWREEHCPVDIDVSKYAYYIEKDFAMLEDADSGIVIWDGESKGSFINMVNLMFLGKACNLYLIKEKRWIEIKALEELEKYAGEPSGWDHTDMEEILTKCGVSMEMQEYMLQAGEKDYYVLINIICTAPISLNSKRDMLINLYNKRNIKDEIYHLVKNNVTDDFTQLKKKIRKSISIKIGDSIWSYIMDAYSDINFAISGLNCGELFGWGVFSLHTEWYDTDVFMEKSSSAGLFLCIDDVIQYIKNEEKENDSEEGWYRIEVWNDIEGKMHHIYNYYTIKDEVCWFEKLEPYEDATGNIYYKSDNRYYNSSFNTYVNFIKTPFKTGDIIHIDCRSFGPSFNGIVLEDEYQYDSCFPTVLFKVPYTDEWNVTPLKFGRFFKDIEVGVYCTPLSALFRVRLVEDEELSEFSEKLLGSYGKDIYKKLCEQENEFISTEELKKIFENT